MLFVRFSFCECGSVVCMSPRPAQRNVLASASRAGNASAAPSAAHSEGGAKGTDHGVSSLKCGRGYAEAAALPSPVVAIISAAEGGPG